MPAAVIEPNRPGGLSIVVQGPLNRGNAVMVAANLAHWRKLYPHAQLICAVSSSACSELVVVSPGVIELCDRIVTAPAAAVLPPIKTDSAGPNHVNLQIAAARAGLGTAEGTHVLRVRNDLIFATRRILERYADAQQAARGGRALFAERVLASQLFTLNPLTAQRMPFHVSDWFHLGRTKDVARLWAAARPATPASASWYRHEPHAPGSNAAERRFLTKLASEQRITFPLFAAAFPDLSLAHHNDAISAAASLRVLADNFAIADMAACGAILPKYQREIDHVSRFTRLECLSQPQLDRIAAAPEQPVHDLFRAEIAALARHNTLWAQLRRNVRRWARRSFSG